MKHVLRSLAWIAGFTTAGILASTQVHAESLFHELNWNGARVLSPEQCRQSASKSDASLEESLFHHLVNRGPARLARGVFSGMEWTPTGRSESIAPPHCRGLALEEKMTTATERPIEAALRPYLNECLDYLQDSWPGPYLSLWRFSSIRYSLCENSRMRKMNWILPDGEIRRGFLGIQPGTDSRPLILIICGVYCNPDNPASYWQIMKLFDEGPFHVLVLGNTTGTQFVSDNEYVSMGGVVDGHSIQNLLDWLESSPLASRINSFHLAGVSLGGHSILAASLYESYRPQRRIPVRSYLVMSPVVDLEASFRRLYKNPPFSFISRMVFSRNYKSIFENNPGLREAFLPGQRLIAASAIPDKTAEVMLDYIRRKRLPLPKPFDSIHPTSPDQIWSLSRLQSHMHLNQISGLVLASKDDPIVAFRQNTQTLEPVAQQVSSERMEVIPFDKGGHNSLSDYLGWEAVAGLYRGYFLQKSPELLRRQHRVRAPLPVRRLPAEYLSLPLIHYQWQSAVDPQGLELSLTFFDRHRSLFCRSVRDPYLAPSRCQKTLGLRYRHSEFPIRSVRAPATQADAEAQTRWLNAEVLLIDSHGKALRYWENPRPAMEWRAYH